MQTTKETNKDFKIIHGVSFNNISVSLYSALKGYATLHIGENQQPVDLDELGLRLLAEQLEYCADVIEEVCPKDYL